MLKLLIITRYTKNYTNHMKKHKNDFTQDEELLCNRRSVPYINKKKIK